jgi:hypothetical protein
MVQAASPSAGFIRRLPGGGLGRCRESRLDPLVAHRISPPGVGSGVTEVTVEEVRSRLPYPEKAEFRVGWFPDSARGCEGETFCLVNVDVGLYQPTYAALQWFYPRLAAGGFLLVNDYNNAHTTGVREAVHRFAGETGAAYTVLPDYGAHAVIVKPRQVDEA